MLGALAVGHHGCQAEPADDEAGPALASAQRVLLGHVARDEGGRRWVFAADAGPRIFGPAALPGARWEAGGREIWLPALGREAREGGALTRLAAPPSDAADGHLVVAGRRWPARRLGGAEDPVRASLAAAEAARAVWREEGASAYRRAQRARGEAAQARGVPTEAAAAYSAAAYAALRARDFAGAEAALARADAALAGLEDSHAEVRVGLIRAQLEVELGRYRPVVGRLERLTALARRHGHHEEAPYLDKTLAEALSLLGRHADALERMSALRPDFEAAGPVAAKTYVADLAWMRTRALVDRRADPEDPGWARARAGTREALARARALGLEASVANILSNLAFLEARSGRAEAAARTLTELSAAPSATRGYGRRLGQIVQGDLHLAAGRFAAAAAAFEAAEAAARAESEGAPSEYTWRAAAGRGRAEAALGHPARADAAFTRALADLDALSMRTRLRRDRARFVEARSEAFDAAIAFYLRAGRPARAFALSEQARLQIWRDLVAQARAPARAGCAAPREALAALEADAWRVAEDRRAAFRARRDAAHARLVRCLDARTAQATAAVQRLDPKAALRALGPDEALVSFVEVGGRTRGLVARAGAVRAPEPGDLRSAVRGAAHVYLVPGGDRTVGRLVRELVPALLEHATVSVLPLAARLGLESRAAGGRARVLGDPTRDLVHARREAESVARRLGVKPALQDAAVRARLWAPGASYLHYAGHGRLDGDDPWQSSLRLADGEVTLDDLLAEPLPFARVALSGCETGARGALGARHRIGLVDALVLSGVRTVVAAHAPVDDAATAAFMAAFYEAGGREAPARAYREVAREHEAARAFFVAGLRR